MKTQIWFIFALLLTVGLKQPVFAGSGFLGDWEPVVTNFDKFEVVGPIRAQEDWNMGLRDLILNWHSQALAAGEFDRELESKFAVPVLVEIPQKDGGWVVADPQIIVGITGDGNSVPEAAFQVEINHVDVNAKPSESLLSDSRIVYQVMYSNPWLIWAREQLKQTHLDRFHFLPLDKADVEKTVGYFETLGTQLGVEFFQNEASHLVIRRFQTINGGTTGRIYAEEYRVLEVGR